MTLITDLTSRPTTDGTEEYIVNVGTTDYKVTGAAITAAVVATHAAYVVSNDAAVASLGTTKLNLAGGVMTGALTLNGAPSSGLHATTKTYVDGLLAAKADAIGQSFDATTTGITAADTTETTAVATTAFVGNKIAYDVFKKTVVNTATQVLTYALRGTIFVTRTTAGACTITLPDSSALTSAARTEFYIVDAGNNAETYNITINCAGSDTFLDGTTSMTITGDGASVLLAVNGTTWIPKDLDATGSTTQAGISRLATNAEALALANATAVVTPSELGNVLDQEIYNSTVISTASKTFVEADSGKWYVTRTATGTCTLTLPDPSALTTPNRFVIEIWDVETAGTNAITINTTAGNIDGASSTTISSDKVGMIFITDGTDYYTIANTSRVSTADTLATILSNGNTSGGSHLVMAAGDYVKSSAGDSVLNLTTNGGQSWSITSDEEAYGIDCEFIFAGRNTAQFGYMRTASEAIGIYLAKDTAGSPNTGSACGILIQGNTANAASSHTTQENPAIIIGSKNSVINVGLDNTVILGGDGVTAAVEGTYIGNNLYGYGGIVTNSATAGVGYATGAGGTVTQATNRTTGVTLSKVTGQITTNNTSLAAGAAATFTVSNTTIIATDIVVLSIVSGATTNQTNVKTTATGTNSFDITVENNHASTAETGAIVVNFAVIKGVAS